MSKWQCHNCGWCCFRWGGGTLSASPRDIRRWKKEKRQDILDRCDFFDTGWADLWFHPETGEELESCPWLKKVRGKPEFKCSINETKPEVCHQYRCERDPCETGNAEKFKQQTLGKTRKQIIAWAGGSNPRR
jgi:Fe-S-cluster containining protein